MSIDFKSHSKNFLLPRVESLIDLAENKGYKDIYGSLNEIREKILKDIFYLVVLGEFKRGKSTFINALLGEDLLPTAVVPLTSVITKIAYGDHPAARVYYQDGRTCAVNIDSIDQFITEKGNPGNEKAVKHLEIFHPSELLARGTVLIDTPGTGSIFEHNTMETYDFIPRVDAAIFLLTVDHPLSRAESDFLKNIRDHVPLIYFVLNKIDHVSEEDRGESKKFIEENLTDNFNQNEGDKCNTKLFPLSARMALEAKTTGNREKLKNSKFIILEEELKSMLERDKDKVVLSSAMVKTRQNLDRLLFQLELESKALAMPLQELKDKEQKLERYMVKARRKAREHKLVIEGEVKALVEEFIQDLNREREDEIRKQVRLMENWCEENSHLSTPEFIKQWNYRLYDHLTNFFKAKKQDLEEQLEEKLWSALAGFYERAEGLVEEVETETAELFDLELPDKSKIDILPEREEFHFKIGTIVDFNPEQPDFFVREKKFILRLIPSFFGRQLLLNEMKSIIAEQIDRNYGRLREDFSKRVKTGMQQAVKTLDEALETLAVNIEKSLQAALEQHSKNAPGIEANISQLQEQKKRIRTIQAEIASGS